MLKLMLMLFRKELVLKRVACSSTRSAEAVIDYRDKLMIRAVNDPPPMSFPSQ